MQDKTFDVTHTDEEWRRLLTQEQYWIMRRHGTEAPGSCALIHEKRPGVRIIALSSFEDEQLVKSAIRAGATSYLLKNISADRLAEAIRSSLAGLPTFAPEIAPALVEERPPALSPIQHGLTHREREVLALLASGLSNSQISRRLNISLNTAKNHVGNILSKLGARNRTEAAGFVLQQAPAQPGKPMHSG